MTDTNGHVDALIAAMAEFGSSFDASKFRLAFESDDSQLLNRVKAVERGSEQLYSCISELTRFGLELSLVLDPSAEMNARRDFRELKVVGVISAGARAATSGIKGTSQAPCT